MSNTFKAVNESAPFKKSREVANRELRAAQKRRQNALVDKYYRGTPEGEEKGPVSAGDRFRNRLRNGLIRTASGHAVPTRRSTFVMLKEASDWKEEEIGLEKGKISNDYKEYQKRGLSVAEAKERIRDKYYKPPTIDPKTGKESISARDALTDRAFFTWAYDTKSFMEMGATDWRTGNGKYKDMFKTQGWIDFLHGNSNAYSDFASRLGTSVPYRQPLGGGPKTEDYLPGGKRYNVLGYQNAVEMNDDGTIKLDENKHPIYVHDEQGRRVPNIYYNPQLKRIIDANPTDPQARHLAELASDSERFTKLIDQAEDPSSVVSQRPEQFEELKQITTELKQAGITSVGAVSLKNFIEKESLSFPGRNVLGRLTGAASPHIDAMFGPGYIQSKVSPGPGQAVGVGEVPTTVTPSAAAAVGSVVTPTTAMPASAVMGSGGGRTGPAAKEGTGAQPVINVDLGQAAEHFANLSKAAEAMNEAAYHMRRTAATQERAARRINNLPGNEQGVLDVDHDDERGQSGDNPPSTPGEQ